MITKEGVAHMLDCYWGDKEPSPVYAVLIKAGGTVTADDTMKRHKGWEEITDYDEKTRPLINFGKSKDGSINNSENTNIVTINKDSTIIGGLVISTSPIKGGTDGLCLSGGPAKKERFMEYGDTFEIKYNMTHKSG